MSVFLSARKTGQGEIEKGENVGVCRAGDAGIVPGLCGAFPSALAAFPPGALSHSCIAI